MSLFKDDSGRTEEPTPHRLDEAADRGQVAMSRELVTSAALATATITLAVVGPLAAARLAATVRDGLDVAADEHLVGDATIHGAVAAFRSTASRLALPLLGFALPVLLVTLLAGYGQIGLRFRKEGLRLDPARLAPDRNLDKLFNLGALVRAGTSLLLLIAVGSVVWTVVSSHAADFATLSERDVGSGFARVFDIAVTCLAWIAALTLFVAAIDYLWQRHNHRKQLRMTRQEVDDERKRTEGDPMVRARIRQAALEVARRRMMEAVPDADVVITNPTHFAIALAYDRARNGAPEVVAKGADQVAAKIREQARAHDVPIYEDPTLARALHRAVKVGQEIPERFYRAVATVLGHVMRIDPRRSHTAPGAPS